MIPAPILEDLGIIIAAGGSSQRYGERDKLLEMLGGLPLFLHSIAAFAAMAAPGSLVVAVRETALEQYRRTAAEFLPEIPIRWVKGGATRCRSVRNALDALPLSRGIVAIHDAARPLASADLLRRLVAEARRVGGAIAAAKVVDSLKKADGSGLISAPVPREDLWRAETPQVFDLEKFRTAMAMLREGDSPTDDAEIMRLAGFPVALVESGELNLKLTLPGDLDKFRGAVSFSRERR